MGSCEHGNEPNVPKMWGISWLVENLFASQEWLHSSELAISWTTQSLGKFNLSVTALVEPCFTNSSLSAKFSSKYTSTHPIPI